MVSRGRECPLWVISCHGSVKVGNVRFTPKSCRAYRPRSCPFRAVLLQDRYPQFDETSCNARPDHTLGHKLPRRGQTGMSALPECDTKATVRVSDQTECISGASVEVFSACCLSGFMPVAARSST